MSLIGNHSVLNKACCHFTNGTATAGAYAANTISNWHKSGDFLNRFSTFDYKTSIPDGYDPSRTIYMAWKDGGLGANGPRVSGLGGCTASLTKGVNCSVTLAGVGTISTANLKTLVQLTATLAGVGALTPPVLRMIIAMIATLAGTGTISSPQLKLLIKINASLSGTGTISSATLKEIANMEAEITSLTPLSPASLASAVWEALAADHNTAGTMGGKLNDAGAAGNPWAALLDDNNDPGTFGERVQKLLTVAKFLGLR